MNRILALATLVILTLSSTHAQETEQQNEISNLDLNQQYEKLKQNAETYGDFKVFRVDRLDEFWSSVNDSIGAVRNDLAASQTFAGEQAAEVENLKQEAIDNEEKFQRNEHAATHITFLGIDFTKSTFRIVISILIGGLALLLGIGYIQFMQNRNIAISSSTECKKLEMEYEEHRKKALEKQVRLNRELQTHKNMIEELRSKSTITKKISA